MNAASQALLKFAETEGAKLANLSQLQRAKEALRARQAQGKAPAPMPGLAPGLKLPPRPGKPAAKGHWERLAAWSEGKKPKDARED
jgi:hypothetical protein